MYWCFDETCYFIWEKSHLFLRQLKWAEWKISIIIKNWFYRFRRQVTSQSSFSMSVMGLLMPVAGLIKARYRGAKAEIDSPFFKLHYRTTSTILFICCLLVTCNDLIGTTISCIHNGPIPGNVLNTYCWIMSTFSIPCKCY